MWLLSRTRRCARLELQERPASSFGSLYKEGSSYAGVPGPQVPGGGARARTRMRNPVSGRARDKASSGFAVPGWPAGEELLSASRMNEHRARRREEEGEGPSLSVPVS